MKHIKLLFHYSIIFLSLMMLLTYSGSVSAKVNACWVDFYADASYQGKHFRATGPTQLNNLLNIKGNNWDKQIESIIIGPNATLTVFENENLKLTLTEMANHPVLMKSLGITRQDILEDSEIIFHANARIPGFGDYHFYHKIRSLKIECNESVNASKITIKNNGCWADFYTDTSYKGKHFRAMGPSQLKTLVYIKGDNWDKQIESIVVGPKAILTVFENKNFKLTLTEMVNHPVLMKSLGITRQDIMEDSEIIFHANTKVFSFGDYHFYHKIRSLKVECVN